MIIFLLFQDFLDLKKSVILGLKNFDLLETFKNYFIIKPVAGGGPLSLLNETCQGIIMNRLAGEPRVLDDFAYLIELLSFHDSGASLF